jgi:hypothetical protein
MTDNPHYMTPQEMSKLICPVGRGAGMPGREIVVDGQILGKPCVSEHCAAWRWAGYFDVESDEYVYSDKYGSCGFVGG